MEMRRKNHPLKNLSLKWSFVLYVTLCILAALLVSMLLSGLFSKLQNDIYKYYNELYQDELARQGDLVVNGEVVQKGAIRFYTENLHDKFSEQDMRLYNFYGAMSVLIVPIVSMICVLVAGVVFYRRKLKYPLRILDSASARIAAGDLDFKVEYDSRNEFGRLAASFETMRESLYDTNREMWRMMEGRRRLNAAFAHDLRTPLTVLRGYCDFLLKYVPDGKINNEKAISTLSTMDVYLKRLEGYTTTMASLQKLDEIELSPKHVSFSSLREELKNIADMLKKRKKLHFSGNGDGLLYIDMTAFSQVCENLVSNAVRYAENEVKVSCFVTDDILGVCVSDDGPGFTPEALKNAAEPYFRDDRDISDATHFGIGLYVCRLLCEKHGGVLSIENAIGGKVTASFASLPAKNNFFDS